jgi:hypothetical protein
MVFAIFCRFFEEERLPCRFARRKAVAVAQVGACMAEAAPAVTGGI